MYMCIVWWDNNKLTSTGDIIKKQQLLTNTLYTQVQVHVYIYMYMDCTWRLNDLENTLFKQSTRIHYIHHSPAG